MAETALDITGMDVAAKRHVGKKIHNCAYRKPTTLGLMKGFDTFYNSPANVRIDTLGLEGGEMAFTFWAGIPEWEGIDPLNPDYNLRRVNLVKRTKLKQGTLMPSAAQMAETMDIYEINRIKTEKGLDNYTMQVAERAGEGFNVMVDNWLWPAVNAVGGAGYGPGDKSRLMQFSYPLQNGFAGNDENGAANAFVYLGINMHDFPELKAINVGTANTPWVLTEQSLEEDILMPLRDRGANIDLMLCGKAAYSHLRQILADRIQAKPDEAMKFSGPFFQLDDGTFVVYESGIDRAPVAELYVGDSSTIRVALDPEGVKKLKLITDWDEMPSAYLLQGYAEIAWVNECPRWWARAYNVEVA